MIGVNIGSLLRLFQAMNGEAGDFKLQPGKTPGEGLDLYSASGHQLQFCNHSLANSFLKGVAVQEKQKSSDQKQQEDRNNTSRSFESFRPWSFHTRMAPRPPAEAAKDSKRRHLLAPGLI